MPSASLGLDELARRLEHVRGLLFTEFVVVGLLAAIAYVAARTLSRPAWRDAALVVVSGAVVTWFVGSTLAALWLGFLLVLYAVVEGTPRSVAPALVVLLLGVLVVAPVRAVGPLGAYGEHAREFTAFATNMALLRLWAYAWDRGAERAPRPTVVRYLAAMLFFPAIVNGPLELVRDFDGGWHPVDRAALAAGARRLAGGIAKLLAVGLALPVGWTAMLDRLGDASTLQLWAVGALLYGWFYLSFSAWTDVAIGLGHLCGRTVPENFFAPWRATDVGDFWRRWHVSFGRWLREYVYLPLGGNRRAHVRNVVLTFLASALWHVWGTAKLLGLGYYPPRAWGGFLVWGMLNAAGVLASAAFVRAAARPTVLVRAATFAFACFCWVPFFLPASISLGAGLRVLARMLWPWI